MARTPTGETPFHLVFGSEAVIPTEVGLTSYRIAYHDEGRNEEGIRLHLNLLDEVQAIVEQQMARYQDLMARHYNTKVRPQHFSFRDLVLRNVTGDTKDATQGKLGPNWERPYRVVNCYRRETYHLEMLD